MRELISTNKNKQTKSAGGGGNESSNFPYLKSSQARKEPRPPTWKTSEGTLSWACRCQGKWQSRWRAKQTSWVVCVSEDLKCWGELETLHVGTKPRTSRHRSSGGERRAQSKRHHAIDRLEERGGHKAKDITPSIVCRREARKEEALDNLPSKDKKWRSSVRLALELFQRYHLEFFQETGWSAYGTFPIAFVISWTEHS